ncbi:MAG: plasmid pRiA4b ORF-3 family protein [Treponema sp.]|jgi:hypothetical protein|nr:plasmid pRiA4b ORF-3 family protein [Treponema sp.]
MSKSVVLSARRIYVLRAKIEGSKPPIWRKLSVPGDYSLEDLHIVLQIAFGWENDHMHSFIIDSTEYGMAESMKMIDVFFDDEIIDENTVCLDDLLAEKQKFTYLYDFGDSWKHTITVSKTIPAEDDTGEPSAPLCLGGARAGPPEDCGGIWGYEEMLEIVKDPAHAHYKETHDWLGDRDPEYFSPEEVNARFKQVFRKTPPPKKTSRKPKKPSA